MINFLSSSIHNMSACTNHFLYLRVSLGLDSRFFIQDQRKIRQTFPRGCSSSFSRKDLFPEPVT